MWLEGGGGRMGVAVPEYGRFVRTSLRFMVVSEERSFSPPPRFLVVFNNYSPKAK